MITITRRQARCLRAVFRRHVLGISHRGVIPPLVFRAEGSQLRARHQYAALAVEHVWPGSGHSDGEIAIPLDALAEIEGPDEAGVVLEGAAPDRTIARWHVHGVPQTRGFDVPAVAGLAAFPELPASWAEAPPGLLDALAEASNTTCEQSTRYALNCLQLSGSEGQIAATDGHQLLIQGGFRLPWQESLLVRRSTIFACRVLPHDRPLRLGRTATHVVLAAGPWTLYLEIQAEGRFPVLGAIIPEPDAVTTRLRLDANDARFLRDALDSLPDGDEQYTPATLDLNGVVAVRARSGDGSPTEVVLSRSNYTGAPIRLSTTREYLGRAIRLGFTEIEIVDATSPLACRDANHRRFAWQPLAKESAIEPSDEVTRIESDSHPTSATSRPGAPPKAKATLSENTDSPRERSRDDGRVATNGHATPEAESPTGLTALIREAESLHEALGDAKARAGRLVVALRRQRKRDRLVSTTLASLRALRLQEVAE